jgi:hypothetical protein
MSSSAMANYNANYNPSADPRLDAHFTGEEVAVNCTADVADADAFSRQPLGKIATLRNPLHTNVLRNVCNALNYLR